MLNVLFHPAFTGLVTEFLSVLWILRDKKGRTLPFLVAGLIANIFDGWRSSPWSWSGRAGLRRGSESITSHPACRIRTSREHRQRARARAFSAPWGLSGHGSHDDCLVPRGAAKSHLGIPCLAYVAEMVTGGPLLYAIVPDAVLSTPFAPGGYIHLRLRRFAIRLSGMPNAFPSLRWYWFRLRAVVCGRRFRFCLSRERSWRPSQPANTTHRPVAGLAFGCFAANAGRLRIARSAAHLSLVLGWSLTVRFARDLLINHAALVQAFACVTVLAAIAHLRRMAF
jgi:hypothetical protein